MKVGLDIFSFVRCCFTYLLPNMEFFYCWYISFLSDFIKLVEKKKVKRLIICMPPRHLKSMMVSTILPAWILGNDPSKKVIVSSYSLALAETLSIDTRKVVKSTEYSEMFPDSIWSKDQQTKRKFITTKGGFRLATSTEGTITGEGGDILIADDPQKPSQIESKQYRDKTHNWFQNTFCSRLNNKKNGAIIVVMQRLHKDDLVARLTNYEESKDVVYQANGWTVLNLALVAKKQEEFRKQGELLNENSIDSKTVEFLKQEAGENVFEAQYQQSPKSENEGIIPKSFIHTTGIDINEIKKNGIYVSVDCAQKIGENNDYTAISLWGTYGNQAVMFDVINKKMEIDQTIKEITNILTKNTVIKVCIEDKASGTPVIQSLQAKFGSKIQPIQASISKTSRVYLAISQFENQNILFHENLHPDVFKQMLSFPCTKHDDILDTITQFANWFGRQSKQEYIPPSIRFL